MKYAIKMSGKHLQWSAAAMRVNRWFEFCETCDAEKLREVSDKLPYLSPDGVMRTLSDCRDSPVVTLGILKTTIDALNCAIAQNYQDDSGIVGMEAKGRAYLSLPSPTVDESLAFSAAVCHWGGGARVLGNLKRHNPGSMLGHRIHHWLTSVPALGPFDAVALGLAVKGLRVSFASKHLRHLEPDRFAVLDEVLSFGLGYAMNPAGYQLFIDQLTHLRDELLAMGEPRRTLAEIEAGIFLLARQKVRSDEAPPEERVE
jgi:hypothetical protein